MNYQLLADSEIYELRRKEGEPYESYQARMHDREVHRCCTVCKFVRTIERVYCPGCGSPNHDLVKPQLSNKITKNTIRPK
jgi:uncharacterized paraquat-inducible protein A